MRRFPHTVMVSLMTLALVLAVGNRAVGQATNSSVTHGQWILRLTPGPQYASSTRFLLVIRIPLYPQVAAWLEDANGNFIDTIYVTKKAAKRSFYSAPASARPEALPVWYHRQPEQQRSVDAVTGATSIGPFEFHSTVGESLSPGRYVVFLEINSSYDYNDRYTRSNSGVNGQPSLVYRAEIQVGRGPTTAVLVPIGTGSVDGSDGLIHSGLEGITTALHLLTGAEIEYRGD